MARRRRMEAPTEEELARLDDAAGFAAKPQGKSGPPIAQIAGEAAALGSVLDPEEEAARARDKVDAEALRQARKAGWDVREIAVAGIGTDAMSRDRMRLDPAEMEELRASIRANGLRMPIEVTEAGEGRYDLISGLRRLTAVRDVHGDGASIRAFVRPPRGAAESLAAMVEENEVRADLTSYERGRVAAMAVRDGVFPDLDAAVAALFAAASKAKRSKVRSFARIHDELGDLLTFPDSLSERQCLKIAAGLKAGQGSALRQALGTGMGVDPDAEWRVLAGALGEGATSPGKAAKPKAKPQYNPAWIPLAGDKMMYADADAKGYCIRLTGPGVDRELVETVMAEIERLLGQIE